MKGLVLLTTVAFVVPYAGDACAAGGDKCLYDPTCRAALTQLMELFLSPTNVPLLTLTQKGQLYQLNAALTLTLQQLQVQVTKANLLFGADPLKIRRRAYEAGSKAFDRRV